MNVNQPNSAAVTSIQLDRLNQATRGRGSDKPAGVERPQPGGPQGAGPSETGSANATYLGEQEAVAIVSAAEGAGVQAGANGQQDPAPQTPLQELIDQWGDPSKQYDFNADGSVNVFDLLDLLSQMSSDGTTPAGGPDDGDVYHAGAASPTEAPVETAELKAAQSDETPKEKIDPTGADEPGEPTLKGLMDAWGTESTQYDLNSDGTVNVFDLLNLLAQLSPQGSSDDAGGGGSSHPALSQFATAAQDRPLSTIADRIHEQLITNGFKQRPPTNLNDVISQLNLNDEQRDGVHKRVLGKYPKGVALNVTG